MVQSFRQKTPVPSLKGLKSCYFGDSISDPNTTIGGTTVMGQYCTALDTYLGTTRVGLGGNANDFTRAAIGGRIMSANQTAQVISGEACVVQCCLSYLPDVVFLELGTNDWYFGNNGAQYVNLTPANITTSWNNLFTTLLANVAVRSVQALVPSASLGGSYTILWQTSTTASILASDSVATINSRLTSPASGPTIPFTASIGLLNGGNPVILTANSVGPNASIVVNPAGITGGTLSVQGGLGGTPSVKAIVVVGTADHTGGPPQSGVPSWATSAADCWRQIDGAHQRWRAWDGYNGIPVVYADMRNAPASVLIDGTHPTHPGGTNYFVDRIKRVLTMAD